MLTHDTIWEAIDRLAQLNGYSTSGLAKAAGLDPTSFNKSKRFNADGRPRWPSTESIARILDLTNVTIIDFMAYNNTEAFMIPMLTLDEAREKNAFDSEGFPKKDLRKETMARVHFSAQCGDDYKLYALHVTDDSFHPFVREGSTVVVAPLASVKRGDRVIVRTRKGEILAKELRRNTMARLDVKALHNDKEHSFDIKDIEWVARIAWISQ